MVRYENGEKNNFFLVLSFFRKNLGARYLICEKEVQIVE